MEEGRAGPEPREPGVAMETKFGALCRPRSPLPVEFLGFIPYFYSWVYSSFLFPWFLSHVFIPGFYSTFLFLGFIPRFYSTFLFLGLFHVLIPGFYSCLFVCFFSPRFYSWFGVGMEGKGIGILLWIGAAWGGESGIPGGSPALNPHPLPKFLLFLPRDISNPRNSNSQEFSLLRCCPSRKELSLKSNLKEKIPPFFLFFLFFLGIPGAAGLTLPPCGDNAAAPGSAKLPKFGIFGG